jgi:hypothetical protein
MALEVRCPECRAKMRLDEPPEPGEAIECPRCGTHFAPAAGRRAAADAAKAKKKDAAGADKPAREKTAVKDRPPRKARAAKPPADPNAPKRKRAKKKKSNKTVLTLMLVGALVILACIGGMGYFLFSSAGKVESMLVHVPGDCNIARGVNSGHIGKYVGYKSEMDRALGGALGECWNDLNVALRMGDTPEYAVHGKVKNGGNAGNVFVFRTRSAFDPKGIGGALGGAEAQSGAQTYYTMPGRSGPLNQAAVYAPSDRIIVVVAAGPRQSDLLAKSVAGKANPDESFWGKMGRTGRRVSSGHIWAIVRADGDTRNYITELVKPIGNDYPELKAQADKSTVYGQWVSFGAKITFGAAIQCGSSEEASKLVDNFRNDPIGSQDETAEIPNSLKQAYGQFRSREMSEFRSNLKFYADGDCAYLRSQMSNREKATQPLTTFANPALADPGSGGGGFGPPPGGRG